MYVGVWCQTEVHAPALQYDPGEIGSVGHWNEVKQGSEWKSLAATSWNQWCRWCGRKQEFMKGHEFRWDHRLIIVWLSFDHDSLMRRDLQDPLQGRPGLKATNSWQIWSGLAVALCCSTSGITSYLLCIYFVHVRDAGPKVPNGALLQHLRTSNSIIRGLMAMNCWRVPLAEFMAPTSLEECLLAATSAKHQDNPILSKVPLVKSSLALLLHADFKSSTSSRILVIFLWSSGSSSVSLIRPGSGSQVVLSLISLFFE